MDKYVRLPASDVAGWVGLAVAVVAIIIVAKKLPIVGRHV